MPSSNTIPPPQTHWGPPNSISAADDDRLGHYSTDAASGMLAWGLNQVRPSQGAQSGLPANVAEFDQEEGSKRHDTPNPTSLIAASALANNNASFPESGTIGTHLHDPYNVRDHTSVEEDAGATNTARRGLSVFRSWWGGDDEDSPSFAHRRRQAKNLDGGVSEGSPSETLKPSQNTLLSNSRNQKQYSHFGHELNHQMHSVEGRVDAVLNDKSKLPMHDNASLWSRIGSVNCNEQKNAYDRCVDDYGGNPEKCQNQWDNYALCSERAPKSSI